MYRECSNSFSTTSLLLTSLSNRLVSDWREDSCKRRVRMAHLRSQLPHSTVFIGVPHSPAMSDHASCSFAPDLRIMGGLYLAARTLDPSTNLFIDVLLL